MPKRGDRIRAPRRDSGWARATESLENPEFRRVFIGNMAFFLAMGGQAIVRAWIASRLTDNNLMLGVVSVAMAVPMFFLSPFGGVLADRIERRSLIIFAQALAMVTEAGVLVLLLAGTLEFWHLVVAAALLGCSFPLIMPARSAIVVDLVGRKSMGAAMSLNMTGVNVTRVLGPAGAGYLISLISVEGAYLVNLGLYGVALVAMWSVRRLPPPPGGRNESVMKNLVEGFRYLKEDRFVLMLLLFGLVPQFLAMPFQTLSPRFADDVWHQGASGFGILNAAIGVGAVAGSAYVAVRSQDKGRLWLMMGSVVAFGVFLAMGVLSSSFWPAVFLVFAANVGASVFSTMNNVAIQLVIPDRVRGRVSSFLMMSVSLPLLGSLPVGAYADEVGLQQAMGHASLLAVVLAITFFLCSPRLRGLDDRVQTEVARH